ncbi:MAG: hypothetical protein KTR31_29730 [Myxococcales bacterium]|nr:hypothetical protein [Myxococcales bacterium]
MQQAGQPRFAAANQFFGYQLWINPSIGSVGGRGNGGQFVYAVPELALVIVYTAAPSTSEYLSYEQDLLAAIVNSCVD